MAVFSLSLEGPSNPRRPVLQSTLPPETSTHPVFETVVAALYSLLLTPTACPSRQAGASILGLALLRS